MLSGGDGALLHARQLWRPRQVIGAQLWVS